MKDSHLSVIIAFGHHRVIEVEIDCINVLVCFDPVDDFIVIALKAASCTRANGSAAHHRMGKSLTLEF